MSTLQCLFDSYMNVDSLMIVNFLYLSAFFNTTNCLNSCSHIHKQRKSLELMWVWDTLHFKSKQMQCKHLQNTCTYHNRNLFYCNEKEQKFFKERYNFKFVKMCMSRMGVWISCTLKDTENDKKNSRSVTLIMMSNLSLCYVCDTKVDKYAWFVYSWKSRSPSQQPCPSLPHWMRELKRVSTRLTLQRLPLLQNQRSALINHPTILLAVFKWNDHKFSV